MALIQYDSLWRPRRSLYLLRCNGRKEVSKQAGKTMSPVEPELAASCHHRNVPIRQSSMIQYHPSDPSNRDAAQPEESASGAAYGCNAYSTLTAAKGNWLVRIKRFPTLLLTVSIPVQRIILPQFVGRSSNCQLPS